MTCVVDVFHTLLWFGRRLVVVLGIGKMDCALENARARWTAWMAAQKSVKTTTKVANDIESQFTTY